MSLADAALGGYGYDQVRQDLGDLQDYTQGEIARVSDQVSQDVRFRPFTVTSSLGGVSTDESGGYTTTLSPEQQALQDMLFGQASGMLGQATQSTADREQEIFNRIRAAQAPQEQIDRLQTEERLAAQGRLGLSSAQYGGANPELYAQENAIANARNQAMIGAMTQAQAEQAQQYDIGSGLFASGYMPQANMLNMLQPAVNLSQLVGTGNREAGGLISQLALGGLAENKDAELAKVQAFQELLATIGASTQGLQGNTGIGWVDSLIDFVF